MNDHPLIDEQSCEAASSRELLATYAQILAELGRREVVRTHDAPSGQYAEWLARSVLGGTLVPNSVKSFDLTDALDRRIQVKARVVWDPTKTSALQLSPFRSFDFDLALVVLFGTTYEVLRAVLLEAAVVEERAVYRAYVNGHVLKAGQALLDLGEDVTARFRDAAQ